MAWQEHLNALKDIAGRRFGRLVIQQYTGRSRWLAQCDCGIATTVRTGDVKRGRTQSCGCLRREASRAAMTGRSHGRSWSTEYTIWRAMKARCYYSKHPGYKNYGGRGITVCERWRRSFEAFYADMGPRPAGLTIECVDNGGNYEPGNCCWATYSEQQRNRRPRQGARERIAA